MIGKEVKEQKAVSVYEVIDILGGIKEGSMTYEQKLALEHAKKLAGTKDASKTIKMLEELNLLSPQSILKVVEIMPKNSMTLKQILSREKRAYTDEDVAKIMEVVKARA